MSIFIIVISFTGILVSGILAGFPSIVIRYHLPQIPMEWFFPPMLIGIIGLSASIDILVADPNRYLNAVIGSAVILGLLYRLSSVPEFVWTELAPTRFIIIRIIRIYWIFFSALVMFTLTKPLILIRRSEFEVNLIRGWYGALLIFSPLLIGYESPEWMIYTSAGVFAVLTILTIFTHHWLILLISSQSKLERIYFKTFLLAITSGYLCWLAISPETTGALAYPELANIPVLSLLVFPAFYYLFGFFSAVTSWHWIQIVQEHTGELESMEKILTRCHSISSAFNEFLLQLIHIMDAEGGELVFCSSGKEQMRISHGERKTAEHILCNTIPLNSNKKDEIITRIWRSLPFSAYESKIFRDKCKKLQLIYNYCQALDAFAKEVRIRTLISTTREAQKTLIPSSPPRVAGLESAAFIMHSEELGGDIYTYRMHRGRLFLSVADARGKGFQASFMMSLFEGAFLTAVQNNTGLMDIYNTINGSLSPLLEQQATFITAVFLEYTFEPTQQISILRAGHPPPIIVRGERPVITVRQGVTPIGIHLDRNHNSVWTIREIDEPVFIILYTDGFLEALIKPESTHAVQTLDNELATITAETFSSLQSNPSAGQVLDAFSSRMGDIKSVRDDVLVVVVKINPLKND